MGPAEGRLWSAFPRGARVPFQAWSCGICGEQNATGKCLDSSSSVFFPPCRPRDVPQLLICQEPHITLATDGVSK